MFEKLDTAQRRQLAANAHHLDPVVIIGKEGLTEAVMHEIDRALTKHELVKIKAAEGDRSKRSILSEQICQALNSTQITSIGRILVVYRRKPETDNDNFSLTSKHKPVDRKKPAALKRQPATSVGKRKSK